MDTRSEIREHLTSRRARITPDRVGLPVYGDTRRLPGLRREEVALLAGVSVDCHTRLERASLSGLTMFAYTVEPGSKSEDALNLLSSWAATPDQAQPARATERT